MKIRITIDAELDTAAMDKYKSYREKLVPTGVDAVTTWLTGADWETGKGGDVAKVFTTTVRTDFLKAMDLKVEEVQA